MGWRNFLTPILNENQYCTTFTNIEILNECDFLTKISELIKVKNKNTINRDIYLNKIMNLPSINEAIREFFYK